MKKLSSLMQVKQNKLIIEKFPGYFLLAALVISFIYLYQVFAPFVTVLLLAAILATAVHPLYDRINRVIKGKSRLASLITCFLVLILIVVPLSVFILLLGRQAFDTYIYISHQLQSGAMDYLVKWQKGGLIYDNLSMIRGNLGNVIDFDSIDIKESILSTAKTLTSWLATQGGNLVKGFGGFLFGLFVMFFALYYFFKDAHLIKKKLMSIIPLPEAYELELMKKFKEISLATLYGIFLTSVAQGVVGGIGFFIAGVPNALFWGTAIALFSLVPVIGTATIWLPTAIILLFSGNIPGGVFLLIWGAGIVSMIDNVLRAFLIGGRMKTNQLLTFLSVFGGMLLFGLIGIIFGPLIMTIFFTLLHIYELEYDGILKK